MLIEAIVLRMEAAELAVLLVAGSVDSKCSKITMRHSVDLVLVAVLIQRMLVLSSYLSWSVEVLDVLVVRWLNDYVAIHFQLLWTPLV